jgi:hypothetical protein
MMLCGSAMLNYVPLFSNDDAILPCRNCLSPYLDSNVGTKKLFYYWISVGVQLFCKYLNEKLLNYLFLVMTGMI